ncbi:MAG: S8 family serine peptidase, partial [Anaerolineales bacterium]
MLVKFLEGTSSGTVSQLVAQVNGQVHAQIAGIGVTVLKVPAGQALQAAATLTASVGVEYAEPNYVAYALVTNPNDPSWGSQYGPVRIQAPLAWDITTGASSVVIAVVDTGVDLDHPDLAAKIVAGYDFVNNDSSAQDDQGHGTHVAGIAAAASNNGVGIAGVSWGARIMPVKVLDSNGSGSYSNVASGIIWAADNGAKVINLSLGGSGGSAALEDAVNYAYGRGALVVAAAGNSGASGVLYPAAYANAVAVAATDASDNVASFSTYGSEVEVAAPGVSIYATYLNDTYASLSGTSMATPHVAGVAAVLAGQTGFGTPAAIRAALQATALDRGATGRDQNYGYGIVQLRDALQYTPGPTTPTPTKTPSPPAGFPFSDDFESGNFGAGWTTFVTEEGRVRVASGYPYQGTYSLLLDDSVSGSQYSTAAAVLTVNLAGQTQVDLEFWWREFNDENHSEDGVFISADNGGTWYRVLSFNGGPNAYQRALIDIDAAAAANGLTLNSSFQIKFQFRDNYPIATDGYAIDNVSVRVGSVPTITPTPTITFTPAPTSTPNSSCAAALAVLDADVSNLSPSAQHTGDEVLVKFDPGASEATVQAYVDAFGAQISGELAELGVMVLKVPAGQVDTVAAGLNQLGMVEFAEPNYIARAFDTVPNDPSWSTQYGPANIQGPPAWDLTIGSTSAVIAVVDTGVDLNHPDLANKIVGGCDFVNRDDTAQDDNGHGTHVAGIAAAASNNGIGITGVSWGARVMP